MKTPTFFLFTILAVVPVAAQVAPVPNPRAPTQDTAKPFAIKSDELGESLAQYQAINKECAPSAALQTDSDTGEVMCKELSKGSTYAGITLQGRNVGFLRSRLRLVEMTFPHADYPSLEEALTEKYGPPSETNVMQRSEIKNILEVVTRKEITEADAPRLPQSMVSNTWTNGASTIYLWEYDLHNGNLQSCLITFFHVALSEEYVKNGEKAAAAKKAKARADM